MAALAASARAETQLVSTTAGHGVSATAHLDFRVTVLPGLRLDAAAMSARAVLASGTLALTQDRQTHWAAPQRHLGHALSTTPSPESPSVSTASTYTLSSP
jgi:hypothetical protein